MSDRYLQQRASTATVDSLTDHSYDGIQEYDNPTPRWWHAIFAGSVVFSVFYVLFWHVSTGGWTNEEGWSDAQKAEVARIFGSVGEMKPDRETILTQMSSPTFMPLAKAIFIGNCAACHRSDGGGDIGVNLCDDSYKNAANIEDLFRVITEGANAGAMPSWKNRLSDNERVILAAYVASLRGTTPASGKGPEGKVIDPWPKATSPAAAKAPAK